MCSCVHRLKVPGIRPGRDGKNGNRRTFRTVYSAISFFFCSVYLRIRSLGAGPRAVLFFFCSYSFVLFSLPFFLVARSPSIPLLPELSRCIRVSPIAIAFALAVTGLLSVVSSMNIDIYHHQHLTPSNPVMPVANRLPIDHSISSSMGSMLVTNSLPIDHLAHHEASFSYLSLVFCSPSIRPLGSAK